MTHASPHRRALLLGLCAASVAAPAVAQAVAFSSVSVDIRPLLGKGLGPYAELVGQALQAELARAYADRIAGRGPRLVVRVDAISLRSYVGPGGRFGFGGGTQSDYLEGEALVVGPRGEILARHPQLSAVPSSSGGSWYDPQSENRRVTALAAHFAGWLRRSAI